MPNIDRRTFLQATMSTSVALAGLPSVVLGSENGGADGPSKPNFLFILADDLLWYDLGCYGNKDVATPHLDSLARDGMRFNNMHCSTALCAPCRSEAYTGLFPFRNGCATNGGRCKPGTKSIAHHLKPLGYQVVLAGKGMIGPDETFPWDRRIGGNGREVEAVIEQQEPFCLISAFKEPHGPHKSFDPKFDPDRITMPKDIPDTPSSRKHRCKYYTAVEKLDKGVGRLLRLLEKHGKADNTMVLFISEQGAPPNGKRTCWQSGVKAASMLRWPGKVTAGSQSDALLHHIDIVPTFIEAAGGQPPAAPAEIDGRSFLNVAIGKQTTHREYLFHQHSYPPNYPVRAVQDGSYKLILNLESERAYTAGIGKMEPPKDDDHTAMLIKRQRDRPPIEFYDLAADPWEFNNLAGKAEHQERISKLKGKLIAWMDQQGDKKIDLARKIKK